jgi:hypothetical protein
MLDKIISGFLNPLGADTAVHNSLSELIMAKMEEPHLSIRGAKKWGILELSTSNHYDQLEKLGKLFLKGLISLEDFLLFNSGGTKICDATYIKREGKGVYGTKILRNYSKGCYELLQDVLFTVDRYGGVNFIYAFKIVNHKKRHRTKPGEIIEAIKTGKIKKGDWLIIDGGLKSGKLMREARKAGVKLVTRLNLNFVVVRFGVKIRKKDVMENIKPINRTIDGKSYEIYYLKRCIWQGTAGNLFLIRGKGYDDFMPLFTTSLNAKPETIIRKYNERTSIEQTFKELKSYLKMEGSYYKKKGSNYGYIFMLCLVYNFVQHIRLYLTDMSFKDVLDELSTYLLRNHPPKCLFSLENAFEAIFGNIAHEESNKTGTILTESIPLSCKVNP